MEKLSIGQRLPLSQISPTGKFLIGLSCQGLAVDYACFGLDEAGKLVDERYMTFFNQPTSPCGGVQIASSKNDLASFAIDTSKLPESIDQIVITASVEVDRALSQLSEGYLGVMDGQVETARFSFTGADFSAERAVMLAKVYRKDGAWRFSVIAQGFNGGLGALVAHFGGVVDNGNAPTPAEAEKPTINPLLLRAEEKAPQLVSLIKHASVSLAKVGLGQHKAKVALVLDISGSMRTLYRTGMVQKFAERILALGCKFDDDGDIDVFLFGENVHQPEPMSIANAENYIEKLIKKHSFESHTRYGLVIEAVRKFYFPDAGGGARTQQVSASVPVYVMFVTDGTTSDKSLTEKQLRWASYEPIFWQFMGIGKGKKSKSKQLAAFDSDFPFLDKLDDLDGRYVDNANYFSVAKPDEHEDADLYDLLMTEYPDWLKLIKQKGMLL